MLSDYFHDQKRLERLRRGPIGSFAEGFIERLEALGRARKTIQNYLGSLSHLVTWLIETRLTLASFDEVAFEAFSRHTSSCRCLGRRAGKREKLVPHIQEFLDHVRVLRTGAEPAFQARKRRRKSKTKVTPEMLECFERWMVENRHVAAATLKVYSYPLNRLFKKLGMEPGAYRAEALRGFIQGDTWHRSRGWTKGTVLAIGMFLRFLVSVGQAPVDIEERVLGRPAGGRKRTLQPWGLLGPFIESFKHILADNHLARRTVDRHIAAVRRFDHWFSGHGYAIEQLDDAAIEAYRDHLLASRLAADRYTFAIGPVRRLIEHLRCHGVLAPGPIVPKPSEPTLLLQFADWMMRHRGLSRATIDIYARVLRELLAELEEDTSSWEARSLRGFLLSYGSRHGRTGVKHAGTAMRVFLRFLAAQGLCRPGLDGAIPPVASWRLSSLPRYLSASQVERVLATCNVATPTGLRNRAILLLLARMGLRASDVWGLRLCDIDWRAATLKLAGKGRRQALLPLTQEVGDAVLAYLEHARPVGRSDRLFLRHRAAAPFARSAAISDIAAAHIRRAGIETDHHGAHVLRHSAATEMLRQGASLDQIGTVLRHRSRETTLLYAKVDVHLLQLVAQPWPEEVSSC